MNRALLALASLALGLLIVNGCAEGQESLSGQIRVLGGEVREWTDPDTGKVYLAVAPAWKNEGPKPVGTVVLGAQLEGPQGVFPKEGDPAVELPKGVSPLATYSGDPVDAGSSIQPSDAPDTWAVLGPKEDVLKATGPNPKAKVEVAWALGGAAAEPPGQDPPKP